MSGALMLGVLLTACSTEVETTTNGENTENAESSAMTCAELKEKVDELEGKEVTLKAISWGSLGSTTGEVSLNLGDEKLEGMKQAPVVAKFSEANADVANGVERDSEVTIKATVNGMNYGSVELKDPTIVK